MNSDILKRVEEKSLSCRQAYKILYDSSYPTRPRRAHFIKLSINVPEEKGVNIFLKVLFFLPVPLFLFRLIFKFAKFNPDDKIPLTKQEILELVGQKGVYLRVNASSGEKILIKTI